MLWLMKSAIQAAFMMKARGCIISMQGTTTRRMGGLPARILTGEKMNRSRLNCRPLVVVVRGFPIFCFLMAEGFIDILPANQVSQGHAGGGDDCRQGPVQALALPRPARAALLSSVLLSSA